jgi:DNA-binding transcriptional regulator LsrR (DeoR family)
MEAMTRSNESETKRENKLQNVATDWSNKNRRLARCDVMTIAAAARLKQVQAQQVLFGECCTASVAAELLRQRIIRSTIAGQQQKKTNSRRRTEAGEEEEELGSATVVGLMWTAAMFQKKDDIMKADSGWIEPEQLRERRARIVCNGDEEREREREYE